MSNKPQMPKDTNNASIPVLTPISKHEFMINDGQAHSITLNNPSNVIRIKTDAAVRFVFGTAGGSANSSSFLRDEYDIHEMRVPYGATHIHFLGTAEGTSVYIEEQG